MSNNEKEKMTLLDLLFPSNKKEDINEEYEPYQFEEEELEEDDYYYEDPD